MPPSYYNSEAAVKRTHLKNVNGPVVQLVRTLACHARGRGFDPHPGRHVLLWLRW